MREGAVSITSCQLELSQAQQRILGLGGKRIVHNEMLVVALGISCVRSERRSPEQSLGV
jgi:hypothetical protein